MMTVAENCCGPSRSLKAIVAQHSAAVCSLDSPRTTNRMRAHHDERFEARAFEVQLENALRIVNLQASSRSPCSLVSRASLQLTLSFA